MDHDEHMNIDLKIFLMACYQQRPKLNVLMSVIEEVAFDRRRMHGKNVDAAIADLHIQKKSEMSLE